MSAEQNKAILRRYIEEIFNKGNIAAVDELIAADFVTRPAGDREYLKGMATEWHAAFPDSEFAVEEMIAEGQKVVICGTYHGTHTGEFQGIPATGKQVTGTWIGMFRIRGRKIVERWVEWDMLSFFQQLGVIPAMGEGGQ